MAGAISGAVCGSAGSPMTAASGATAGEPGEVPAWCLPANGCKLAVAGFGAMLENAATALAGFSTTDCCRLFLPRNLQRADAENGLSGSSRHVQGSETLKPVLQAWPPLLPGRRPMRVSPFVQRDHRPAGRGKTSQDNGQWRQRRVSTGWRPAALPDDIRSLPTIARSPTGHSQLPQVNAEGIGGRRISQSPDTHRDKGRIGAAAVRAAGRGTAFRASTVSARRSLTSATGITHRIVAV
jgi:hypothetical protein